MLCYRCGSHVPDGSEACGACGQKFSSGNLRQATGTFSRRKAGQSGIDGAPFKSGEVLADRYVIKDVVGAGPLGYVFKAQDKEIDVDVAVKVVSPKLVQTAEERRTFAREIRLARKLSHNNIIRVYEDGEASDRPFYTMQYLDGLTLRRIIDLRKEKAQFFSLKEIEPIFAQIAAGLEAAHKVIPHTDLKPENVVVLPDLLKITDFGVGSAIPRQPFAAAQRARGGLRYLAPEYVSGQDFDKRVDVYAMGVLLGEMLAHLFPEGGSSPELRARNAELPVAIEAIYRRATNENPLSRYPSVAEFWSELDALIVRVSPKAPPPPPKAATRGAADDPAFEVRLDDTATPSVPSRLPPPVSEEPRRREPARRLPPPVPDPAFAQPEPPRGASRPPAPADGAEPPRKRRAAHTPPPTRRRSTTGPLLWLAILGIGAGVGGGIGFVTLFHKPASAGGADPGPTPALAADVGQSDEARQLEEERRRLGEEARRLEAEKQAAQARRAEDEKRAEAERKAREEEEERARKAALAKAFPGKDDKRPTPAVTERPRGCPGGMRLIPAGSFRMGSAKDDPMTGFDEKPLVATEVRAYCIDVYESPNRAGAMPQVGVSFAAAESACRARGKRLCSEEEWERACKGPGNARFPYGSTFDPDACATEDGAGDARAVAASGSFARCRSAFGIADLSGNVAEWTSSKYSDAVKDRTIKGGAADRPDYDTRCASRKNGSPSVPKTRLGFRCCADP